MALLLWVRFVGLIRLAGSGPLPAGARRRRLGRRAARARSNAAAQGSGIQTPLTHMRVDRSDDETMIYLVLSE